MASPYRITELAVFSIYHVSIPNLYSPFLGGEMKYSIIATVCLSLPWCTILCRMMVATTPTNIMFSLVIHILSQILMFCKQQR